MFGRYVISVIVICMSALRAAAQTPPAAVPPSPPPPASTDAPPAAAPPVQPAAPTAAPPAAPAIEIYGYAALNAFASTRTFSARDSQAQVAAAAGQVGGAFLMSSRNTRLGARFAFQDDNIVSAKLSATLEIDFRAGYASGAAATAWPNAIPRLRLANGVATWATAAGPLKVTAGQDYSPFAPLDPTTLGFTVQNTGNLWRRAAQLKLSYAPVLGPIELAMAAAVLSPSDGASAAPYSVDFGFGSRARRPALEGRFGATLKPASGVVVSAGVSGAAGRRSAPSPGEESQREASRLDSSDNLSIALDFDVRIPYVQVKGEAYSGTAIEDEFNGILANATGVRSTGYWVQALIKPADVVCVTAGLGVARARSSDLASNNLTTSRTRNRELTGGIIVALSKRWKAAFEASDTRSTYYDGDSQRGLLMVVSNHLAF